MRRRALAVVMLLVGASGAGCGSSSGGSVGDAGAPGSDASSSDDADAGPDADGGLVSLDDFPAAFARRFCRRVYDCCLPPDRAIASPGTDQAMCVEAMTENARANGEILLSSGGIAYSAEAAQHCLELLDANTCSNVFDTRDGALVVCQDVFEGTRAIGEGCDDGIQCASGACTGSACIPPIACAPTDVLNDVGGCVPRVALGAPCDFPEQCPAGATCANSVCKTRGAAGAPCLNINDCVGACAPVSSGSLEDVCRPGYCAGP
jgi:EB module